jgi:hypothetical protein
VHLNATALGAPRVYQAQVAVGFTFKSGLFFDRLARIVRIILAGPPCLRPYAAVNRSGLCCVKVKLVDPHDVMDSSCCIM